MSDRPENKEFQSVDWENLSEKRDWSSTAWTAAAILIILLGFFGGMVFRTSLTGGPNIPEEQAPGLQNVHRADQYTGS